MNSVIKGASYILAHAPDMVIHNGTTQTTERVVNPTSEYLTSLPKALRSFEDAKGYLPNQVYIGGKTPLDLPALEQPWFDKIDKKAARFSKVGEIMPQDEFYLLIKACDAFNLVALEKDFSAKTFVQFKKHPLLGEDIFSKIGEGVPKADIEKAIKEEHAEGLYLNGQLVGCIKKGHAIDE
ncbi:MAG: glycine reductase, partial [Firmicutes bacterium]|nr:glycine reductase [Bacillota bacterium]